MKDLRYRLMPMFVALEKETFGIIAQTTNDSLDAVCNL
jgi:hypothetical protein